MAKILVNKLGIFGGQLSRQSVVLTAVSCRVLVNQVREFHPTACKTVYNSDLLHV